MIRIDLESPVPIEEQIRQSIREAIALGKVLPGDELPSVRQLAADLGIHWNTVARAYRRLRDEGLLAIGKGRGAFVRNRSSETRTDSAEVQKRIGKKIREALTEGKLGGLSLEKTERLIHKHLRLWAQAERKEGRAP